MIYLVKTCFTGQLSLLLSKNQENYCECEKIKIVADGEVNL